LPAQAGRAGRFRGDRHASGRSHSAHRGRRLRRGHAGAVQDPSHRETGRGPLFPGNGQHGVRTARPAAVPGQVQAPGPRTDHLRRGPRSAPLLPEPHHGRVRGDPPAHPGGAVRHAPHPILGLVRLMARRVLVTGLGTFWGGRIAQALEADPSVEVIIGLDTREPRVKLERTEYVRSDENYSILSRIVRATGVDTIAHTFLVVDSTQMSSRSMHEINVIGTMNLLAAASAPG